MPATMMTNSTAAVRVVLLSGDSTSACIVSGFASMPLADIRSLLAKHASPSALRRRVLDARDVAIRQLAATYAATSGRALADTVHRDLVRYGASGHRVNMAPPADTKRALLHRALDLIGGGKVPSSALIRAILAGVRTG
jgi:hypothetical protein